MNLEPNLKAEHGQLQLEIEEEEEEVEICNFKKKISLKEKKKKGLCIYIGCRERESPTSSRRRRLIFPSVWGSANLTACVRS